MFFDSLNFIMMQIEPRDDLNNIYGEAAALTTANRTYMKKILCLLVFFVGSAVCTHAQSADTTVQFPAIRFGTVVPLSRYVQLYSGQRPIEPNAPVALSREEIAQLQIHFLRDSLTIEDGAQFLKVTTTATSRSKQVLDDNVQFAVTFRRLSDANADLRELERIGKQIAPLSYMNPQLIQGVPVQVDSLDQWSYVFIRIEPEQEIVKYYGRMKNRLEYRILVKGERIEAGFALSIPKVLYDTRRDDPVVYGNTSAMFRFYYLNGESGLRYPVTVGLGTIGVESPIDVSRSGGGFVISLYLDIVQLLRTAGIKLSSRINAGLDVSPFFPIKHKSRLLIGVRLGIVP